MIKARASTIITHVVGWILFLSLPVLFVSNQSREMELLATLGSIYTWLFFITYIFIFYFHTWFLIPALYLAKKYLLYAGSLVIMLVAVWMLKPFDHMIRSQPFPAANLRPAPSINGPREHPPANGPRDGALRPGPRRRGLPKLDVISIFLYLMILALSAAVRMSQQLRRVEQRAMQAEADKANAELSFLKAQINPHFLFNTLNNIYSLAASKSEHTAESIMKLSNIMRYLTDEVREEFVPLENEVAFISDYIDLQRLRVGDKINVEFLVSGKIVGKKIAPLILMTFIENVFKYGVSIHEPSGIEIQLSVDKDAIRFFCRNKLYDARRNAESTGIGIDNTRKRLEYLYTGKYELEINSEKGLYTVQLTLKD